MKERLDTKEIAELMFIQMNEDLKSQRSCSRIMSEELVQEVEVLFKMNHTKHYEYKVKPMLPGVVRFIVNKITLYV